MPAHRAKPVCLEENAKKLPYKASKNIRYLFDAQARYNVLLSLRYLLSLITADDVKAIAKELKEEDKVGYFDMFDPAVNVPYAEYFTRPLVREFNHPLFIAYAYNGGPGFTRRLLGKNHLFKKNNPLDPWFSMEMIPYEESRVYGKKVLANYVIYQKKFGKEIKMLDLLQQSLVY